MTRSLKQIFAAGALVAISGAAFADAAVPAGYESSATAPAGATPLQPDAGVVFYLYDAVGTTTYALSYYTGLDISDIGPAAMDDAGLELTWQINPSSWSGYGNINDLVWGVAAGDSGSPNTADDGGLITTVNLGGGSITTLSNSQMEGRAAPYNDNITPANNLTPSPLDVQTVANEGNDVRAQIADIPDFFWTGDANVPGDTLAMFKYTDSGGRGTNDNPANISPQYAGIWSFNLGTGTLKYSVAAVPIPAAVWLLFSGLAGMGVIGRRRNKVAAVAA